MAAWRPFRGLLYGGLIADAGSRAYGDRVELSLRRSGNPAVLPRMQDDLLPWLLNTAKEHSASSPIWSPGIAVCVVLAAEGYPGKVRSGDLISGLAEDGQLPGEGKDLVVFHAAPSATGSACSPVAAACWA